MSWLSGASKLTKVVSPSDIPKRAAPLALAPAPDSVNSQPIATKQALIRQSSDLFDGWISPSNPIDQLKLGRMPKIGYIKWIPEHGDILISRLIEASGDRLSFFDLDIFRGQDSPAIRPLIMRAAEREPRRYRKLIISKLLQYKAFGLDTVVLTLDWMPPLREIVFACRDLGIRTVLIPHESVFSTVDFYYTHPKRRTNAPLCDHVLCWGGLQEEIFTGRGYPSSRITKVGSLKLDADVSYSRVATGDQIRSLLDVPAVSKIVAFTMQPMDNYSDKKDARVRQATAIEHALDYCEERGQFLLVRTPPSRDKLIPDELHTRIERSKFATLDIAGEYLLSPEETIAHADLVLSVNSTMLFEARLMQKPAISMQYIPVPSIWENTDIGFAREKDTFYRLADEFLSLSSHPLGGDAWQWAVDRFADAAFGFDGNSAYRAAHKLSRLRTEQYSKMQVGLAPFGDAHTFASATATVSNALVNEFGIDIIRDKLALSGVARTKSERDAAAGDIFVTLEDVQDREFEARLQSLGRPVYRLKQSDIKSW